MHEPAIPHDHALAISIQARRQLLQTLTQREAENCLELQLLQVQIERLRRRQGRTPLRAATTHDFNLQPRRAA